MAHLASTLKIRETLFKTNQAPSEEDSKAIDAQLAQLREERSRLAVRLAEIDAAIPQLKAIQHPIRYIPDDVLGRIFEYATPWCLEDGAEKDSFPPGWFLDETSAPWNLSYVCRNWRAVCLSLPLLWSASCVPWVESYSGWVERLDTVYRRSGPLPLRLYFHHIPQGRLPIVLSLESAHRWRCVRLNIHWDRDSNDDITVLHDYLFPHLTHLALCQEGQKREFPKIVAPCLQNLELVDACIPYRCLNLPWSQITRYKSTESDHVFIGLMKNLKEIIIEEDSGLRLWRNLDIQNVVSMNGVRRLEYIHTNDEPETRRGSFYTRFFTHYRFASLHTLIIFDESPEDEEFFAFSLPSVVELSLSFQRPHMIRGILLATPSVESLHLQSRSGQVRLMQCLGFERRAPVANLRQLRHILLTLIEGPHLDIPALSRAITTVKLNDTLPLETVSFYSGTLGKEPPRCTSGSYWVKMIQQGSGILDKKTPWSTSGSYWVQEIQQGIANEVEKWTEEGIQVHCHYNVEHRFA
ncbi:hypothetical protein CYLTODRAFT_425316, partial [Cylindrobasidium torrendii FP15055 ss-10]